MVERGTDAELTDEIFFSSKNSALAKARVSIWVMVASSVALFAFISAQTITSVLVAIGFVLVLFLPIDWYIRRQLKIGQAMVTLKDDAIESPAFPGKIKRIFWRDVERVSVDYDRELPVLKFFLKANADMARNQRFLPQRRQTEPTLQLSVFSRDVQEKLVNAVAIRLQRAPFMSKPLTVEREFLEQLRDLAPHIWVTYALIAVNVVVWLATLNSGAGFWQTPSEWLLYWGGNAASEVQRGEWWRLFSASFLHSSGMHLFMNMLGLFLVGMIAERVYGPWLFALVYLGFGLIGSALSLSFAAQTTVSVGASSAVYGVAGVLLVAVFQYRKQWPEFFSIRTIGPIALYLGYASESRFGGVDAAAYFGSLLGGGLLALVMPKRFDAEFFIKAQKTRAILILLVIPVVTVGLVLVAPKATIDQGKIAASAKFWDQGMKNFVETLEAVQKDQLAVKAGTVSAQESDDRSRRVYAPAFRQVIEDITQWTLRPGDPRAASRADVIEMSGLIAEASEMESVLDEKTGKLEPVDTVRMAQIEAEMDVVFERTKRNTELMKKELGSINMNYR